MLWPNIGQIFAIDRWVPHFNDPAGVILCEYPDKLYLSRLQELDGLSYF